MTTTVQSLPQNLKSAVAALTAHGCRSAFELFGDGDVETGKIRFALSSVSYAAANTGFSSPLVVDVDRELLAVHNLVPFQTQPEYDVKGDYDDDLDALADARVDRAVAASHELESARLLRLLTAFSSALDEWALGDIDGARPFVEELAAAGVRVSFDSFLPGRIN